MGTHALGGRRAAFRLVLTALTALAAVIGTSIATALPASAAGTLVSISVTPTLVNVPLGETQQFTATGTYLGGSTANITDSVTWASSVTADATVSATGDATAVATGASTISAKSGLITGTAVLTVIPAVLLTISVTPTVENLPVGESQQYTATGTYSSGSTVNLTDLATWSSTETNYATVSNASGSQGDVTGVATGASTISAAYDSITGESLVTVISAALLTIAVSPLTANIAAGDSEQFTATGTYSNGSSANITDSVTWSTSSSTYATVSNTSGTEGEVTAVATGAATITATDPSDSLIFGSSAVTVLPAVLLSISVSPPLVNVPAGETQQFSATGTYSNGTTENLTDTATWASSVTSDVTISNAAGSQGLATAVTTGGSTVSATDGLISGTAVVTVLPAVLVAITVSPLTQNLPVGESQQFTATGDFSDGSTENLTDTVTWSSTATNDVSVSNASGSQGYATAVATGAATIEATDGDIFGAAEVTVLPAVLIGITVSPGAVNVPLGDSQQFTATGDLSDGSTENLTDTVTWSTSASTVASVSNAAGSQGDATAVGTGASDITATDGAITGFGVITVLPAELVTIDVSPTASNLPAGETEKFHATGIYTDGTTQDLSDVVTWSSSETQYATVSNAAGTQGEVTAVATGASTISATDGSITGEALVTILPAVLVAITVSPPLANVPVGETQDFTAVGQYSDGTTQNLTKTVTWSSSATNDVSISNSAGSQGVATALATGAATIEAADGAITGVAEVTVLPAVLLAIEVNPGATNLPVGETEQFSAIGEYSDGSQQDLTDSVTWSSLETDYVTVSNAKHEQGVVTAVAVGASTITATDPTTGIFGTSVVTVLPAVLLSISVTPAVGNIPVGETDQYTATGIYSDGTQQNLTDSVTWSTSSSTYLTVSNASGSQGEVTAVATGAGTVTATDPSSGIFGVAAVTILPAVLVTIEVSPPFADVTVGATQALTATGIYSDGSTESLTDLVTWSSSETKYATVSNASGAQGVVTGVADGASTITATDESSGIFGVAVVTVLPVGTSTSITISPNTGPIRTHVTVTGSGFTPGDSIKILYLTSSTGAAHPKYHVCFATVLSNGTFTCMGKIRGTKASGEIGPHTVEAKIRHTTTVVTSTIFTLTPNT
ncbi:MAG: Ig-like domain-containing protein [Acidimicrobiales bacterium]